MKKLKVNAGKGYDILIEKGLIKDCGKYISAVTRAKKTAVVTDSNVAPLYLEAVEKSLKEQGFEVVSYIFEAGEESKTTKTLVEIVEFLAENELTRDDLVVALGGGVCGDIAGFAAAVYLRGIDFVQIPTTLLAQVDSSVGGKTAVDLPQGKNLCGAFHQPSLVLIDALALDTLSEHYFSDGMGEVIKYGCIKSASLFERLQREGAKDFIEDLIFECVDIKRQVVENDEKEHGERALLNFGHTCGHAIEKLWSFKTVSHGEAVGIGMAMIAQAGENAGITEKGTCEKICALLEKYNLKTKDTHSAEEIVSAMNADKKRTGAGIKLAVISKIGESYVLPVEAEKIAGFFGVNV